MRRLQLSTVLLPAQRHLPPILLLPFHIIHSRHPPCPLALLSKDGVSHQPKPSPAKENARFRLPSHRLDQPPRRRIHRESSPCSYRKLQACSLSAEICSARDGTIRNLLLVIKWLRWPPCSPARTFQQWRQHLGQPWNSYPRRRIPFASSMSWWKCVLLADVICFRYGRSQGERSANRFFSCVSGCDIKHPRCGKARQSTILASPQSVGLQNVDIPKVLVLTVKNIVGGREACNTQARL